MQSVLFICTGNVFRSLVAEHALKALIGSDVGYTVNSAGIEALPQAVHPLIRERLRLKGCDLVTHEPRKLSRDLLDKTTLPVAMGFNHQDFLRETFNREVRLFNEVCFQKREPILDLHEALPNWQSDLKASRAYVLSVIEYIFTAMPAFVTALHALERRGHTLPD
jgi:protein-tyrosine phosphatase